MNYRWRRKRLHDIWFGDSMRMYERICARLQQEYIKIIRHFSVIASGECLFLLENSPFEELLD